MPMQLTPQLEAKVEQLLATGRYAAAEEVVAEALRLLDEHERRRRVHESLIEAEEQARRGEVVEWTSELRQQLRSEAEEMARRGERPDPDVCP